MNLKAHVVSLLLAVAALALTRPIEARPIVGMYPGYAGRAYWPSDASCFGTDGFGGAVNSCATSRFFVLHLPNDDVNGSRVISVLRPGQTYGCTVYAFTTAGTLAASGVVGVGQTNVTMNFQSYDLVEVRCNVPAGATFTGAHVQ